jgi:Lysylphosphatidylglycerol synthase TM region
MTTWWGKYRPVLRPMLLLTLSFVVAWLVVQLVGSIDWSAVGTALSSVDAWQLLVLGGLLLVRQVCNAIPLTRFVPGLPLPKSVQSDLTANLIGTVAPPPSDVVLRVAMFRSWGISAVDGMAGVTLNSFTFYGVRFLAPAIGALLLAVYEVEQERLLAGLGSAAIATAILVGLWLVSRGERLAARLGRTAGAVVARFRDSVDPDQWADAVRDFSARMGGTVRSGLLPALLGLLAMVAVDATILLASLRFVGVGGDLLPTVVVVAGLFLAYPLTIMPLVGLGILDAALLAGYVEVAGLDAEPQIVAGIVLWRTVTLLGSLLLGVGALLSWRRSPAHAAAEAEAAQAAAEATAVEGEPGQR